jgi:hypothetical protein
LKGDHGALARINADPCILMKLLVILDIHSATAITLSMDIINHSARSAQGQDDDRVDDFMRVAALAVSVPGNTKRHVNMKPKIEVGMFSQ